MTVAPWVRLTAVRRRPLVIIMILGVAVVLTISLGILQNGRVSILQDFQATQAKLAESVTADLLGYLQSFDRDTRLAAALAEETRSQTAIEPSAQDHVIQAAFVAQVTAVASYRTIALFSADGRVPVVAVAPTEDQSRIAPALMAASAPVAREAMSRQRTSLFGPIPIGDKRSFYLYASPAGPGEAVVVSVDASLVLPVAGRGGRGRQTMVAVDPNGAVWIGCETRASCRLFLPGSDGQRRIQELLHPTPAHRRPSPALSDPSLPLPARVVIGTAPAIDSPLGRWSVAFIASAAEIDAREERLIAQLLLTSAAVIATMLGVGFFIVRQRASAAALGARLQTAQEIANLRERSERILENVPAGILGVTADGRIAMVNRFYTERLQQHPQGAQGETTAWIGRIRPHLEKALASKRTQILTDHDSGVAGIQLSDYDVRIIPLAQPADDVAALIMVEDLSELHDLQRQLIRAEKLVTVGVLSAGIAHEVGTPLAVIRGRAEHLLEVTEDGAAANALRAIVEQIDHISSTIRQVLEFCRTDPIAIGVTDVERCVAEAVKLLEWRFARKCITVSQKVEQFLPLIAADPNQFGQLIINLLMNACDASPDGGLIEVMANVDRIQGDRLRFAVIDHGTGISPENAHAVFDPYFTTKKRGEGTGLGLAIVAQIARLHHGEVTLVSAPGEGTTATVLWPVASPQGEGAIA